MFDASGGTYASKKQKLVSEQIPKFNDFLPNQTWFFLFIISASPEQTNNPHQHQFLLLFLSFNPNNSSSYYL